MAALYLHNSIWVPDGSASSPHARTISTSTLHTDHSHFTQPLLQPSTSESVAYLDLLSRQPTHPNEHAPPIGLDFRGDPTTTRERKGYAERRIRRRLRRLKVVIAILELIMAAWSLYTTVRYFVAFAISSSSTGQAVALALGTASAVALAVLLSVTAIPFFKTYFLGSLEVLLTVRLVLRSLVSFLFFAPAAINFALVFAWRHAGSTSLDTRTRCTADIDVLWSVHSHPSCLRPPPWGVWLGLAITRLVLTAAIVAVYHLALSSYARLRRPSLHRHRSTNSESTFLGSPNMLSGTALPAESGHQHHRATSSSTLTVVGSPSPSRILRSSRGGSGSLPSTPENAPHARLPLSPRSSSGEALANEEGEFDPYADLPSAAGVPHPLPPPLEPAERALQSFVERLRALVAQASHEDAAAAQGTGHGHAASSSTSDDEEDEDEDEDEGEQLSPPSPSFYGYTYDEFGRPIPPDHVRILNSYIRRMPTIESIGSRELATAAGTATASTSVATASLYQEVILGVPGGSRAPTRSGTISTHAGTEASGSGSSWVEAVPSRPVSASLSLTLVSAAVELSRRRGSTGSANALGGSPLHTPIAEEPPPVPMPPTPLALSQTQSRVRPLPRPPNPRADSM